MPGMIPMFILARRRQFNHNDVSSIGYSGERSSSSSSLQSRSRLLWQDGCLLEPTAREAKERLDEKLLKSQRNSEMNIPITTTTTTKLNNIIKSAGARRQFASNGHQQQDSLTPTTMIKRRFIVGAKKLAGRGGWKGLEEKERRQKSEYSCVICLDKLKDDDHDHVAGGRDVDVDVDHKQVVITLPCDHKFHSGCLLPWLHTNSHCPCCRTHISF